MTGKNTIINYSRCDFKHCNDGKCRALKACEKKVLKQGEAFEPPYIDPGMCTGCQKCIASCPSGAIQRSK